MSRIDYSRLLTAEDRRDRERRRDAAHARAAARETLAHSDWMVIRAIETGKPVPPEVAQARAGARALLAADPDGAGGPGGAASGRRPAAG